MLLSEDGKSFTAFDMYVPDASMTSVINLYGTKTRYIRLDIARGSYVSIFEFAAYEATEADVEAGKDRVERVNVAQGKPVTATTHEASYVKENAVDGDTTTRWGSLPSGQAWLQVDLEQVYRLNGLELFLESAWVPYRIEYSTDGKSYQTLYEGAKDELRVVLDDLGEIEARYIRLSRDGENWFSIYEIAVYGE